MRRFAFILCRAKTIIAQKSSVKNLLSLKGASGYKNLFSFLLVSSVLFVTSCKKEAITQSNEVSSITSTNVSDGIMAQITDRTTFPLNEYLYTTNGNPYPLVNNQKLNTIDTSKFVNVMDYGAKGDGKTFDDNAIKSALNNAQYGVIFPRGKTFLVSKTTILMLNHDLTIWAYGATIKMADFKRYSFLTLQAADRSGTYHYNILWLGGTLDGNRVNQDYPTGPNAQTWVEPGGVFLDFQYFDFVLVKDVNIINNVVSGVTADACRLVMMTDSKGSNGAPISYYNAAKRQGPYFKVTRPYYKTAYFNNLTGDGGSIGIMASWPEHEELDASTLVVINNCHFYNQAQDGIHIEDSYKFFMYKSSVGADVDPKYNPKIHISNRVGVVSIKSCDFNNGRVAFNNASSLKLGIVDSCNFITTQSGGAEYFIHNATFVVNCTFKGKTQRELTFAHYSRHSTYSDFGSTKSITLSTQNGVVEGCSFANGSSPVSLTNGTVLFNCTFTNVTNPNQNKTPSNDDWKKPFTSYIDIYSDSGKYLGRITSGAN